MIKNLLLMFCLMAAWSTQAQQRLVAGRVTDGTDATGLPGVSILVKGSTQVTVTDSDGKYSIGANSGDVLIFSFIGFEPQEVTVSTQSIVDLTLTASIKQLDEIVVIGYGEKSQKLMTESIGTIQSKEIQLLPVASADAALQGRVSGVQITNVDGTPGSPVAIRIRGVGTTGNSQPLFVIDGIPIGYDAGSNINPLDIESMSVLKDASATAVYGVRAANGVVLITTKRGKTSKPKITFDSYYGVQSFPKTYSWNNTAEYVKLAQEGIDNRNAQDGLVVGNPGFQVIHPDLRAGSPYLNINTDWQKAVIKDAPITSTNLSVSGGNESANYFVSAGYFGQNAMIPKWDLDRYNLRVNSDYKVGKRFKLGQTLALSYQEVYRGMNAGGDGFLFAGTANMPPFFSIYDNNSPNSPIAGNRYGFNGNLNVGGLTIANQFGINNILENTDRTTRLLGGLYGELEIIKGLKFRTAASIDFSYTRNTGWSPGYTNTEMGLDRSINAYNDSRGENATQVFTNTLTYSNTFGDHSINVLAGVEYQKFRGNGLSYGGNDYLSSDPAFYQSIKNQQGISTTINGQPARIFANAGSSLFNESLAGYIGRVSYDYKTKYLVTVSVRRDGTSRFAPENRYGTFPAVSAAWRIKEEPFFSNVSFVSDLKIRASWGQAGNQLTANFPYVGRISFTPDYGLGGSSLQAPTLAIFPNREIGWETVETTDAGFDVSFLNNKISLLATYYNRNSKDILVGLPIPNISGFGSTSANAGLVNNKGIEIELGYNGTIAKDLTFTVSGNITTVKNTLVSLSKGVEEFASGDYRTAIGNPIGYFYGYRALGVYQNAAQAAQALPDKVTSNLKPRPGDVIFEDNNGPAPAGSPAGQQFSGNPDGQIDFNDRTYLGKTIPDFYYGLSFTANYKGLDLFHYL